MSFAKLLVALSMTIAQSDAPDVQPIKELKGFSFLIGVWKVPDTGEAEEASQDKWDGPYLSYRWILRGAKVEAEMFYFQDGKRQSIGKGIIGRTNEGTIKEWWFSAKDDYDTFDFTPRGKAWLLENDLTWMLLEKVDDRTIKTTGKRRDGEEFAKPEVDIWKLVKKVKKE